MLTLSTYRTAKRRPSSFGDVVATLLTLGRRKKDDPFLLLDDWPRGFVQAYCSGDKCFVVEWHSRYQPRRPDYGLARAQREKPTGKVVKRSHRGLPALNTYENDRLSHGEVVDLLQAFWLKRPRPRRFFWRDLSQALARYQKMKEAGKVE